MVPPLDFEIKILASLTDWFDSTRKKLQALVSSFLIFEVGNLKIGKWLKLGILERWNRVVRRSEGKVDRKDRRNVILKVECLDRRIDRVGEDAKVRRLLREWEREEMG